MSDPESPSAARGAVHAEPDDETVLRWVARGRMLAELHFDHDYELQRIDQHRENYLRAFPPVTLRAVETPPPSPNIDRAIADMRRASAQIDNAADGMAYQLGLISLALMARKFLRDFDSAPPALPAPPDVQALQLLITTIEKCWSEIPIHRRAQLMSEGYSLDPAFKILRAALAASSGRRHESPQSTNGL